MQIWDYAVFALTLMSSAAIGFYYACHGGKQKTNSEFLMADRNMSIFPVSLSLLASFLSAITMLGTASELYFYGTMYWIVGISYIIAITVTATVFIPIFYDLKLTSAYEYLERRFHKSVRKIASFNVILQMTVFLGIVMYAPALALEAVTGFPWTHSVLALGVVCTFYTTIGGMKAVMWTDVLQIFIMFGGMLIVVICGCWQLGGISNVFSAAQRTNRFQFFDLDTNPLKRHTMWSLVFGGTVTWLVIYGSNQSQVQRYLTCRSKRSAQIAIWLNLPGLLLLLFLCGFAGLVAFARYENCDPLSIDLISKNDQILPFYVIDNFGHIPGFTGLFVASIFSGAMSTVSSGLNSLVAITLEDFIKPHCAAKGHCQNIAENVLLSKFLAVVFGILAISLAVIASKLGNMIQACFALFGMIGGPIMSTFLLGILFPFSTWQGALAGLVVGEIMSFYLGIASYIYRRASPLASLSTVGCPNETEPYFHHSVNFNLTKVEIDYRSEYDLDLYHMSYMWQGVWAVLWTLVVGLIVSCLTGCNKSNQIEPGLTIKWTQSKKNTKTSDDSMEMQKSRQ